MCGHYTLSFKEWLRYCVYVVYPVSIEHKILIVEYGATYKVIINGIESEIKTRNFDDASDPATVFLDANEILTDLKTKIDSKNIADLTVTVLSDCLELVFSGTSEFTQLEATGGLGNSALQSYITDVVDIVGTLDMVDIVDILFPH